MTEVRRLTVRGRYDCIPTITTFVAEAASAAGLNEDESFHCRMAVDEACTNIIEHAYGGEDKGAIEVKCLIEPGVCSIQIVDRGKSFDPEAVPPPSFGEKLDEIRPGGIGLHLMRQMMSLVRFEFEADRNILTMVKSHMAGIDETKPEPPENVHSRQLRTDVWLVAPEGRLDAAGSPRLEEALTRMLERGRSWLVVDMSHVSYISSRGLKTLVSAWRKSGDAGGGLVLFGMNPRVASVFEMVGFTHIFDTYGSMEEAVDAVAAQRD